MCYAQVKNGSFMCFFSFRFAALCHCFWLMFRVIFLFGQEKGIIHENSIQLNNEKEVAYEIVYFSNETNKNAAAASSIFRVQ